MNCRDTRQRLAVSRFPAPAEKDDLAFAHLSRCGACRRYLAEEAALVERLSRIEIEKAPQQFKRRLFERLSRHYWSKAARRRRVRRQRFGIGCAAAALALALWLFWPSGSSQILSRLIEDHQQNLPARVILDSQVPGEIEAWFEGKLDFPLSLEVPAGTRILGARLCKIEGRRAALVLYESDSRLVSWFTFPGPIEPALSGEKPLTHVENGYNLVLWERDGLNHAVVSELGIERLRQLAGHSE